MSATGRRLRLGRGGSPPLIGEPDFVRSNAGGRERCAGSGQGPERSLSEERYGGASSRKVRLVAAFFRLLFCRVLFVIGGKPSTFVHVLCCHRPTVSCWQSKNAKQKVQASIKQPWQSQPLLRHTQLLLLLIPTPTIVIRMTTRTTCPKLPP